MTDAAWSFAEYQPDAATQAPLDVVLREATHADVAGLAVLQAEARGGDTERWAAQIGKGVEDEQRLVVVAEVRGELAGYANAAYLPEHPRDHSPAGYYLTGVTVAPRLRRRGVGTLLTRHRMAWVLERDRYVWCFVSAANRASLDLHRELGFSIVRSGSAFQGVGFAAGDGFLLRASGPGGPPRAVRP